MNYSDINKDLVWKIGGFSYPERAVSFLKRFEDSFCIFSRSVRQIYSNYEIQCTSMISNSVVALPNPYAYHDTFFNIPDEAILPTGMVISPGEIHSKDNWMLCYRNKKKNIWKGISLQKGLEKFKHKYGEDDPFLPIILNTDLRESSVNDMPMMHLHRISLKKLEVLSDLQRSDIMKTVEEKICSLAA